MRMLKTRSVAAVCAAALGALAAGANAQSGLDDVKEVTTADAAALLLQPVDPQGQTGLSESLANNGIDTSDPTTFTQQSVPVIGEEILTQDRFEGEAGPLRILNCSPGPFQVQTFNSTDTVLWIPFETVTVDVGQTTNLKCATESCTLKVDVNGPYPSRSGPQVWAQKDLHNTNGAHISQGCDVYK